MRDAPYAGLYIVFYEKGKELASKALSLRPDLTVPNAALHSGSGESGRVCDGRVRTACGPKLTC